MSCHLVSVPPQSKITASTATGVNVAARPGPRASRGERPAGRGGDDDSTLDLGWNLSTAGSL